MDQTLITAFVSILVAILSSGWFANVISKRLSSNDIVAKIDNLEYKIDQNQAETYRTRILRFNGELKRGTRHDEEEFNDCLNAIDGYESFCKAHPSYPNNKAILAIENIKEVYKKAYKENDFE